MAGMGTHSKPVDGIPVANGHAPSFMTFAVPPELQVRQSGPVTPWPQPPEPDRWRHVTSTARVMTEHRGWLAAIPVVLVNSVAFGAQLGFWRVHVPPRIRGGTSGAGAGVDRDLPGVARASRPAR